MVKIAGKPISRLWGHVDDVDLDEAFVVTRMMDRDGPRLAALMDGFHIICCWNGPFKLASYLLPDAHAETDKKRLPNLPIDLLPPIGARKTRGVRASMKTERRTRMMTKVLKGTALLSLLEPSSRRTRSALCMMDVHDIIVK